MENPERRNTRNSPERVYTTYVSEGTYNGTVRVVCVGQECACAAAVITLSRSRLEMMNVYTCIYSDTDSEGSPVPVKMEQK